jgi:hypothetical protein
VGAPVVGELAPGAPVRLGKAHNGFVAVHSVTGIGGAPTMLRERSKWLRRLSTGDIRTGTPRTPRRRVSPSARSARTATRSRKAPHALHDATPLGRKGHGTLAVALPALRERSRFGADL